MIGVYTITNSIDGLNADVCKVNRIEKAEKRRLIRNGNRSRNNRVSTR
jgi:hypothetical protein